MKTIKYLILLPAVLFCFNSFSQDAKKKETIEIKTSAQCEMCKERIEKALAYTKGVKKSNLDINSKKITVTFNPKKISVEKIREVISKAGYDADDMAADVKAYEMLPGCCKKGGHE